MDLREVECYWRTRNITKSFIYSSFPFRNKNRNEK